MTLIYCISQHPSLCRIVTILTTLNRLDRSPIILEEIVLKADLIAKVTHKFIFLKCFDIFCLDESKSADQSEEVRSRNTFGRVLMRKD
jgi:hypothetical protein